MTFPSTEEQTAIVNAAVTSNANIIVQALAGAAKTSTLVLVAEALSSKSILCVAFNKSIQMEMQDRLPSNAKARTLNSLGHKAWSDSIGRRLTLDTSKTYRLLKEALASLDSPGDQKDLGDMFTELMHIIDSGKNSGWIPEVYKHPSAKPLLDDTEFFSGLDEVPTPLVEEIVTAVSVASLNEAFRGVVDFNDQILMPTVFPSTFERYDVVLVDEAQDLSALNHAMVKKLAKKRIIAVGDECQAIYGFRGAHANSMEQLRKTFDMAPYSLTITFRCPVKIVELARSRAPAMRYPPGTKQGAVVHYDKGWDASMIPDFSAIICRNNAPLLSLAMKLLRNGRYPELSGNDISKFLIKTLRGLGKPSMDQASVLDAINAWEELKLPKARVKSKIVDQAACLRIFAKQGQTLADAISYAEHVFSVSGPIKLMTGHKSKGLEFDHVFFLDEDLIGKGGQEDNLRYVIQTRTMDTLHYVYSAKFVDPTEEVEDD